MALGVRPRWAWAARVVVAETLEERCFLPELELAWSLVAVVAEAVRAKCR